MNSRYPLRPLGDVLTLGLDPVVIEPTATYQTAGILSYGRGLFARPAITGAETSYKQYFRIHRDQVVFSRLFAWEGAAALVTPEFDGYYVSSEFPTLTVDLEKASPAYLGYAMRWPEFHGALAGATRGLGLRRQRVHVEEFLAIEVPLPDIEEQRRTSGRVESVFAKIEGLSAAQRVASRMFDQVPWATLSEQFNQLRDSWPSARLVDIVEVNPESWNGQGSESSSRFVYIDIGSVTNGRAAIKAPSELAVEEAPSRARRVVRANDVLVATVRPNLRGTALVPEELDGAICSTGFAVLRPTRLVPEFLLVQMLSPSVVDQLAVESHGGHYPAVIDDRLRNLQVVIPDHRTQVAVGAHLRRHLDLGWRANDVARWAGRLRSALQVSVLNHAFQGLMA